MLRGVIVGRAQIIVVLATLAPPSASTAVLPEQSDRMYWTLIHSPNSYQVLLYAFYMVLLIDFLLWGPQVCFFGVSAICHSATAILSNTRYM